MNKENSLVIWLKDIKKENVNIVGGKSANLGEMISSVNVPVPGGFSTTAFAFDQFIQNNGLEERISGTLEGVDEEDVNALDDAGKKIRAMVLAANLQEQLKKEIIEHYHKLVEDEKEEFVAIRSSATSEDLPEASFAGQQETFLNVKGDKDVLQKVKECYASLFTDRAIYYRIKRGFKNVKISLAVAVERMVFSKSSGVMFTLDVSNGDRSVIMIEASYGLGEYVVQGVVTPDTYYTGKKDGEIARKIISKEKSKKLVRKQDGGVSEVEIGPDEASKQCLSDEQIKELAGYGKRIEDHYGHPMDIEWALDERNNRLFIVQARSETAWSGKGASKGAATEKKGNTENAELITKGLPASPGVGSGTARVLLDLNEIDKFKEGEVLVTKMTTPDWVMVMKKASAIVTDEGGMTCHAAIVSRELGIPCIVGTASVEKKATEVIKNGEMITVNARDGTVYRGNINIEQPKEANRAAAGVQASEIITGVKIFVNLSEPGMAEKSASLPVDGVGLMREEFLWAQIGEHPLSMIKNGQSQKIIDTLAEGIGKVCSAFNPRPVILRFSDFKTDEYKNLKGGKEFEPDESNPMLGWRGASRYYHKGYEEAFILELKAVKKVRESSGLKNLWVMIPFTRTVDELKKVLAIMKDNGLERTEDFKIFLMAEIPSNIILADKFNEYIDGYSVGSNDLTMLTLGADRNNGLMSEIFDERNLAVKRLINHLIKTAHKDGKTVSICGQAPSQYDEIVEFLVRADIDDISVNPDSAVHVRELVASVERRIELEAATGSVKKDKDLNF